MVRQLHGWVQACFGVIVFLVFGFTGILAPTAADASPTELGPAFDYHFWTAPLPLPVVEGPGFTVTNPGVDVSLNPQPLPPFPDPGANVDLTNPGSPVYTYPPSPATVYTINWGDNLGGGAVSFHLPIGPGDPNFDPGNFGFTAMGPDETTYNIMFQISAPIEPGSFVELNPQPLPPFPDPGFSFIQFSFATTGDPTLTFQMSNGTTPYGFAPVPEPGTLSMFALGLTTFWGCWRRRRRS